MDIRTLTPISIFSSSKEMRNSPTMSESFGCTIPQVLNLCTRRRSCSRSPTPEGAHQPSKENNSEVVNSTTFDLKIPYQERTSPVLNQPHTYQNFPQSEQFHNNNNNNNNNMDKFPFLDQFHTHTSPPGLLRPSTGVAQMTTELDSSEEGSVKSDTLSDFTSFSVVPNMGRSKVTRPFKAYPKDPFFLAIGASTADAILGKESTEAYAEFRQKMLLQVRANNPQPGITNTKMRRTSLPTSIQELEGRDASYWEKRRKNNEAAKRSRDARRAKEDEIAIRAAYLEQENLKLKYEIAALRNETTKLRCLLYN